MKFRDYTGKMVEAPKDQAIIVANLEDGVIIWSRSKRNVHQVRYALQVKLFRSDIAASEEFGHCALHHATCEGRLKT